jgi:hypothetical protein
MVNCDAGRCSRLIFNANSGRVREVFVYRNGAWVNPCRQMESGK